jgi:hypothetical protein
MGASTASAASNLMASAARSMPPLSSRPCRRLFGFTILWTCLCFVLFRIFANEDSAMLVQLPDSILNTRELLQNEMVTKARKESTISLPANPLGELMYDRSPKKTDKELVADLEKQLPNFPLVYLLDKKGYHYKNKTCAKFPTIYDINVNNIYWQETDTSNGTFYLYGAYLDVRKNNRLVLIYYLLFLHWLFFISQLIFRKKFRNGTSIAYIHFLIILFQQRCPYVFFKHFFLDFLKQLFL